MKRNLKEEQFLICHRSHDFADALRRWKKVARLAKLKMATIAEAGGYPVVALSSAEPARDENGLYVSAGIHGDEPAPVTGLLEWAEKNVHCLRSRPVTIFPCLNPWGLVHNTRADQDGRDLNRRFDREGGEVICRWLDHMAGRRFGVAVTLHEDYDARGTYVYELGQRGVWAGDRLLSYCDAILPRHRGNVEGRRARRGVVRRTSGIAEIVRQIDGMPEAIYLHLNHAPVSLTFETPSEFSLYRRVRAQEKFLKGVSEVLGVRKS